MDKHITKDIKLALFLLCEQAYGAKIVTSDNDVTSDTLSLFIGRELIDAIGYNDEITNHDVVLTLRSFASYMRTAAEDLNKMADYALSVAGHYQITSHLPKLPAGRCIRCGEMITREQVCCSDEAIYVMDGTEVNYHNTPEHFDDSFQPKEYVSELISEPICTACCSHSRHDYPMFSSEYE